MSKNLAVVTLSACQTDHFFLVSEHTLTLCWIFVVMASQNKRFEQQRVKLWDLRSFPVCFKHLAASVSNLCQGSLLSLRGN